MAKKNSVLYLTNLPAPYKMEYFNQLSKKYDLHILVERKNASDRNPKWIKDKKHCFEVKYLKGLKFGTSSSISFDVIKHIKERYDVIIVNGYSSPTTIIAICYLSLRKIPFILSCDGMIPRKSHAFREIIKRNLLKKATVCLSSGKMNTEALSFYGITKDKIKVYPFSSVKDVDIDSSIPNKLYFKRKIGCKRKKLILYVGQMIPRKGVDILVNAFQRIKNNDIELICVGGGVPYFKHTKDSRISYIDFQDKETLRDYYCAADIFILPTREDVWGLVVNEAMAHGCPVITTTMCGAGVEMIDNSINGFIVPVDDLGALVAIIKDLIQKEELDNLSYECLKTAHKFTIEKMAERTAEIIEEYIRRKK